ncbi:MAG: VOC family protein [Candidatus Binatia bacterium]
MLKPRKVGHVVLQAHDVERAEKFYTEVLGFEVVTRLRRPKGVFFSLGEQHHDLAVLEVPRTTETPNGARPGLHHVALQVGSWSELKEFYRLLKRHDVQITATIDHGITRSIYFLDPEGNQFELYCDEGTDGLDRIRRGEAQAFTPLNFEAEL